MKKLIVSFLFIASLIFSQEGSFHTTFKGNTLDVITDPKNIAMGESFVANEKSSNSFLENPAAISSEKLSTFYNYRYHGWVDFADDMNFISVGVSASTSAGKFAFGYNRFSSGDINVINYDTSSINYKSTVITFAYSYSIIDNLTLGAGVKLFNYKTTTTHSLQYKIESNSPLLFDLGALYKIEGLIELDNFNDQLNFGLSIQNFGTDYEETYSNSLTGSNTYKRNLPRFARAGFAYKTEMLTGEKLKANVDITLTGEYYSLLNPREDEKHDVDYWGVGTEIKLFKIIALRAGGTLFPNYSLLYERGKFNWRYGAGLFFPLTIIGMPLKLNLDYAYIPITATDLAGEFSQRDNLYAFGLNISVF